MSCIFLHSGFVLVQIYGNITVEKWNAYFKWIYINQWYMLGMHVTN